MQYVALGSSFAAGIGLGPRAAGSPRVCMRSTNGYPQHLARLQGLSLVDMTCSGATAKQVLRGGQMFMGPQIAAVGPETGLVTLTAGGNDIRYVGDLALLGARAMRSPIGWALRRLWKGPLAPEQRAYPVVQALLVEIVAEIRRRSPQARIVLATYPTILPPQGTCAALGLDVGEVTAMRAVGDGLAAATLAAARDSGALAVDMHRLGAEHHACAAQPWVNGWRNAEGTQFHPTLAGAKAMAQAISEALDASAMPAA